MGGLFLYGLLLVAYVVCGHLMLEYLNGQRIKTFVLLPYKIWSTIIYLVGGILLGLETFILEVRICLK